MSSRKQSEVKTTMDSVSIVTARLWVSGTNGSASGPDMTGSFVNGTDLGIAVTYGSGSLGLPSGSMRLTLPAENRYPRMLDWNVSFEGTGTLLTSFAGTTGDQTLRQPSNYRIVKYGHNSANGTFDFGFVTQLMSSSAGAMIGTGHMIGAVPGDEAHSTSPAATVTFHAILRNTDRDR